jgi:hypothetical protein
VKSLKPRLDCIEVAHRGALQDLTLFVQAVHSSIDEHTSLLLQQSEELRKAADAANHPPSLSVFAPKNFLGDAANSFQRAATRMPVILFEMAFIYRISLYDAALSDLVRAVLLSRPEMLKSKKVFTTEQILEQPDMEALVGVMADREVNEFSRQSVEGQAAWIEDHLGIAFIEEESKLASMVEFNARRNLLVHANGVVDQQYRRLVKNPKFLLGERAVVDYNDWSACDVLMQHLIEGLMTSVRAKFAA